MSDEQGPNDDLVSECPKAAEIKWGEETGRGTVVEGQAPAQDLPQIKEFADWENTPVAVEDWSTAEKN